VQFFIKRLTQAEACVRSHYAWFHRKAAQPALRVGASCASETFTSVLNTP